MGYALPGDDEGAGGLIGTVDLDNEEHQGDPDDPRHHADESPDQQQYEDEMEGKGEDEDDEGVLEEEEEEEEID